MIKNKKVSIIIRTFNEERWIAPCLKSIFNQTYNNLEVIIVDNRSTDKTVEQASLYDTKIINIDEFYPGKAINLGIENSSGDIIVCLSGHCIPKDNHWLDKLICDLNDPKIAGVYGKQEPLTFTPDSDKRDLIITFGLDKRIQKKDPFFHNANSAFTRDIWQKYPFDNKVTNIEDRLWGKKVIDQGYHIIYEPEASVYHHHGIHQDGDKKRLRNIIRILEKNQFIENKYNIDDKLDCCAIVPVMGDPPLMNTKIKALDYTIRSIKESKTITHSVLAADSLSLIEEAKDLGFDFIIHRPVSLSSPYITVIDVLKYALEELSFKDLHPQVATFISVTYPFRPKKLIDEVVNMLIESSCTSVVPSISEYRSVWGFKEGEIIRLDEGTMPHDFKKGINIGINGLGSAYNVEALNNNWINEKVGLYPIDDLMSQIDIRDKKGIALANSFLDLWWESNYRDKNK